MANYQSFFQSPPAGVLREIYTSISGDTVEELFRHSKFPRHPDYVEVLARFDASLSINSSGYGQRLSTFYVVSNYVLNYLPTFCTLKLP